WSVTSGSGSSSIFSSTSGTSTTYTMPTGHSTITATISSSRNTYIISYNKNNGSGTTMSTTTASCGANTTLRTNTYTRSGYSFLGWSTSSTATTATYTDGGGINLERTSSLTLYAVWSNYMQDYKLADCKSHASSGNVTLYDKRDSKSYIIRYINDACWMIQNLAYKGTNSDSSGQMTLDTDTSNVNSNTILSYDDLTSGSTYNIARLHLGATGLSGTGAWYNYAAASAGTITGSSNSTKANYDICPKNWHLPSYNTSPGSVSGMIGYKNVFNVMHGGYYDLGGLQGDTIYGRWWGAEACSGQARYGLIYANSSFEIDSSCTRQCGFYIRCVRTS
ncbi:InlB B-repeat-containing protein, partial [Candidatus Saccharibacteria bacterium]|nr:InlB B-repeat-containing protein [Candidatus Saccharibacteria bacterium]